MLVPCDRVLQDAEQGQSLISTFHGMKIQVLENQAIPSNAVMPKDWAVYSKYWLTPDEEKLLYSGTLEISWPDGQDFIKGELTTANPSFESLSFAFKFNAFPIGQAGKLKIVHRVFCQGKQVAGPDETFVEVHILQESATAV